MKLALAGPAAEKLFEDVGWYLLDYLSLDCDYGRRYASYCIGNGCPSRGVERRG